MKKITWAAVIAAFLFVVPCGVQAQFLHPGCLHSQADFDRIEAQIKDGSRPDITKAWNVFASNWMLYKEDCWLNAISGSSLDRGAGANNFAHSERDFGMCYIKAIYWKLMKGSSNGAERARAVKVADEAVALLNRYAVQITGIGGNSNYALLAGFQGWQVANAAEILQEYSGWKRSDLQRFKQWVYDVWFASNYDFLYRQNGQCDSHYMSNWDIASITSTQAIGIFLDDPYIYNYAMMYLKQGTSNAALTEGVCGSAPTGASWKGYLPYFWSVDSVNRVAGTHYQAPCGYLCQNQENTRDQGHSQVALGAQVQTCEQAWNQGDDLWDFNNRIMAGGIEYTAGWCGADSSDSTFLAHYPNAPWWTDCGKSETYQAAISYASRENRTPIYQIGYNHFANRMGLNMPYSKRLHALVAASWSGGVEWGTGANSYQNFSDVAGFGDLMHNEDSALIHPTLLRGTLTMVSGSSASTQLTAVTGTTIKGLTAGKFYNFSELSNIKAGSVLRLQPKIVDGSEDTGLWSWDDDSTLTTREREVTMNHSLILRARYTNAQGAVSTQLFSLHVEGEGWTPTVTPYYIYNGSVGHDTLVYIKKNSSITLGLSYKAGTAKRTVVWQRYSGGKWYAAASTDELALSNLMTGATYRGIYTNKAGATAIYTFTLAVAEVDPYIVCDGDTVAGTHLVVPVGSSVKLTATPNDVLGKSYLSKRAFDWIIDEDTVQSHILGFHYGADSTRIIDLSDTLCLNNLQSSAQCTLVYHRITSAGTASTSTTFNYSIPVCNLNDVETGYYYIIDPVSGRYLSNSDATFTTYDADNDDAFQWQLRRLLAYEKRCMIVSKVSTAKHLSDAGVFTTLANYNTYSFNMWHKVGDENLYAIQNSNKSNSLFWGIDQSTGAITATATVCTSLPFLIKPVVPDGIETPEGEDNSPLLHWSLQGTHLTVEAAEAGALSLYTAAGSLLGRYSCVAGTNDLSLDALPAGLLIGRYTAAASGRFEAIKIMCKRR